MASLTIKDMQGDSLTASSNEHLISPLEGYIVAIQSPFIVGLTPENAIKLRDFLIAAIENNSSRQDVQQKEYDRG